MKTLEQQRAAHALQQTARFKDRQDSFKQLYRSYVDRLGPAILMNGLGQALATEKAAAGSGGSNNDRESAHQELYDSLKNWLCREGGTYPPGDDLLVAITTHDQADYMRAQAEALAWLEWHKKCCRAMLPAADGNEE